MKNDSITFGSSFYEAVNAENIAQNPSELTYEQTHTIKTPKPVELAAIAMADVHRIKEVCETMKKAQFPWGELLLGCATLFFGASFGALAGKLPYEFSFVSILFYTVFPVLGVGCIVGYVFYRYAGIMDTRRYGKEIENIMKNLGEGDGK